MDEKDYELLLKLHETRNITKVSQQLFMTQPGITRRIQKMESELECQLFLRSKKGIIFTPAGEGILPFAQAILKNSRMLKEYVAASQNYICGTLNLGANTHFTRHRLPPIIKQYSQDYPHVDIQVTTDQSKHIFRMLQRDEISIAIIRGEYNWDDGMQLISTEPMCLICSHENSHLPLSGYPYISRHTDPATNACIQSWLAAHGLNTQSKLRIDDINSCKEMARYGIGWCILPRLCLDDFDGYMEELYLENGEPFVRNTYVLYKHPYEQLPQVKLFLEYLKQDCRTDK